MTLSKNSANRATQGMAYEDHRLRELGDVRAQIVCDILDAFTVPGAITVTGNGVLLLIGMAKRLFAPKRLPSRLIVTQTVDVDQRMHSPEVTAVTRRGRLSPCFASDLVAEREFDALLPFGDCEEGVRTPETAHGRATPPTTSSTNAVLMLVAVRQPMIGREYASITNATYTHPAHVNTYV